MATGIIFSMSGINSRHHYLPTYTILMISENVEFLRPFRKWRPLEIFQCRQYIRDIIIYPHMKCRWNRILLNLCGIMAAILEMASARNCSMSEIYSVHHNLPTYEMSLKSDNIEFVRYCGGHFENVDARNFSISGINSGHHNLLTYEI
jgi:hypothetical protein